MTGKFVSIEHTQPTMNQTRWLALMQRLGFDQNQESFIALTAAYQQRHRHYHSSEHIDACLHHLDRVSEQCQERDEMELSLWFHDAIYKPFSSRNEEESADWAVTFLQQNGADAERCQRVRDLILATCHNAAPEPGDQALLVDIDLTILGASPSAYAEFERNVRREYRWVPGWLYRRKRAGLLRGFLERTRIYANEPFFSEREASARQNLERAITELEPG